MRLVLDDDDIRRIARALARELRAGSDVLDQTSPDVRAAGVRRVMAAVRSGELPGSISGRRLAVQREDLEAWRTRTAVAASVHDEPNGTLRDEIRSRLGIVPQDQQSPSTRPR